MMDIETLATAEIQGALAALPRVKSFIHDGDKEPSWDGNIYLYSDENFNKKGITKLAAQVKGQLAEADGLQEISFSIEVADLENYYRNGGCLYFVVCISPTNPRKKAIFYKTLLPYDLRELLTAKGTQKTITVKLERFPDDIIGGLNVLLHFTHNAVFQASYHMISDENLAKARDLSKGNVSLSFSYNFVGKNIFDIIFDTPAYEYRETDFGVKIPIGKNIGLYSLEREESSPVSCADKIYFPAFRVCRKKHIQEMKIGQGILISVNEAEKKQVISYTPTGTLEQQITDIEFYHAMMEERQMMLGGIVINIPFTSLTPEEIQERKEKLEYFKTLQQAFLAAGHKGDVNINDFTDEDWEKCQVLISAFINKKSRFTKPNDGVGFFCFTIGNASLLLLISQNGDSSQVLNPYDAAIKTEMEGDDNKIPVSHFCFINEENLRQVSKFDFDAVMSSIKSVPLCKEYQEHLILLLLKMLRAYDAGANDPDMLSYCEQFAKWLLEQDANSLPCKINLYQIFKRERALTAEEISVLHEIMESQEVPDELMAGIYILLSDWRNFSKHFDKLTKDCQDYFMSYPIFNLLPENVRANYETEQAQGGC